MGGASQALDHPASLPRFWSCTGQLPGQTSRVTCDKRSGGLRVPQGPLGQWHLSGLEEEHKGGIRFSGKKLRMDAETAAQGWEANGQGQRRDWT